MTQNPFDTIERQLIELRNQLSEKQSGPQWMSLDELCEYLGLSKSSVYKMTMADEIPLYRLGRILKFRRDEIDDWIIHHKIKKQSPQGVEVEE